MRINTKPGFTVTDALSYIEEVLEIHEMHNRFDLFKIRAKDLNHMRDIIEHKIRTIPNILETQSMTVKTKKEEQIVSLEKDITNTKKDDF